jgi:hypothetical protein
MILVPLVCDKRAKATYWDTSSSRIGTRKTLLDVECGGSRLGAARRYKAVRGAERSIGGGVPNTHVPSSLAHLTDGHPRRAVVAPDHVA